MTWLQFLLGSLATYRLSLMFSLESGPGRIFQKLRRVPPPKSATREGMSCLHCESAWWSLVAVGYFLFTEEIKWHQAPLFWLGFSAAAIVLHHAFTEDFKRK